MSEIINGKDKVISFMDQISNDEQREQDFGSIKNSFNNKIRLLNKCKDDCKDHCFKNILCGIYRKSLPVSDVYKNVYSTDLDDGFTNFITTNCNPNLGSYVTDACKRSAFAKKLVEAVNSLVNEEYKDKEINIDEVDPEELVFKSTDDMQKKLDVIKNDLNSDEISDAIRTNVLNSASSEINRAKEAKQKLKDLEDELVSNSDINTKEAVENVMSIKGFNKGKFYTPTLFEGIVIGESSKVNEETNIPDDFDSMLLFRESNENADPVMDYVFIEAVKEYTKLSVLKALKLESFDKRDIENIAEKYARNEM
jgi:hypothetical protein